MDRNSSPHHSQQHEQYDVPIHEQRTLSPNRRPRHSVWSDDAKSTRRIHADNGLDPRLQSSDTHPPWPVPLILSPSAQTGVQRDIQHTAWNHRNSQASDAESQYSTETAVPNHYHAGQNTTEAIPPLTFWRRIRGEGRRKIGWGASLRAVATSSWLNALLIFVPIAWGIQYAKVSHITMFAFCFIAIIPLSKLLDFGGEQLALYCGKDVGDLIVITLNNAVETTLAMVLLAKCDLKLLQSTIIGVVLLRLLLVPGAAFLTGGVHTAAQELHPHVVQLNNTLLTVGALTLLLPAAFFAALDRTDMNGYAVVVNDVMRGDFLQLSRASAVFLLIVYICSRFYLHDPPGEKDSLHEHANAPDALKVEVARMEREEPEVNPWACILLLIIAVVLMAVTTEFLVHSVNPMRKRLGLKQEWFGLFLLPLVSYSADGILSAVFYIRHYFQRFLGKPEPPTTLAQGRSIDLGIQFLLFWMPVLVIIGWFASKPMSLLFDLFEVAILLGACFLVNYVTADAKTNWAEGLMMVIFYLMILITAWFYPGQSDVYHMLSCGSVAKSLAEPGKFAINKAYVNHTIPKANYTQAINQTLDTAAAIEILNERLQKLLDLHGVLPQQRH